MSEWYDSQRKSYSDFRQLLQERMDKANPRRRLTSIETKRLNRLEAIELSSKAELEPTLQSIKKAVDNGEFDSLLEEQLAYGSHLKKYL